MSQFMEYLLQEKKVLWQRQLTRRVHVALEWKPADMWRGAFPARKDGALHWWVIIIPCLPLHFEIK